MESRYTSLCVVAAVTVLGLGIWSSGAVAQSAGSSSLRESTPLQRDSVTGTIEAYCDSRNIPAMAVAIFDAEGLLYRHTVGDATETTPFYVGSMSKALTATAVVRLADREAIELEAPANRYLSFQLPDAITVADLLHHRSGISRAAGYPGWSGASGDLATYVERLDPGGETGEFRYSNLNYMLLGRILEEVAGESYPGPLREQVAEPLGMEQTYAKRSPGQVPELVSGHQYFFGFPTRQSETGYHSYEIPAGFVAASVEDMARFGRFHLGDGRWNGSRLVSEGMFDRMHRPPSGNRGYAMGLEVGELRGERILEHDGLNRAYHGAMVLVPRHEVGVVVLTNVNSYGAGAAETLSRRLAVMTIGEPTESMTNLEVLGRIAIGLVLLAILIAFIVRIAEWNRMGRRVGLVPGAWTRIGSVIAMAVGVVLGVRWYVGVPLMAMWNTQPDLTLFLVLAPVVGVVNRVLGEWQRAAELESPEHLE